MVAFLLVFIASRTAVNSVFFIRCLKRTWDQKLSSGLLLMFMSTHIFQFRFECCVVKRHDYVPMGFERLAKATTVTAPSTMKIKVVAPPDGKSSLLCWRSLIIEEFDDVAFLHEPGVACTLDGYFRCFSLSAGPGSQCSLASVTQGRLQVATIGTAVSETDIVAS